MEVSNLLQKYTKYGNLVKQKGIFDLGGSSKVDNIKIRLDKKLDIGFKLSKILKKKNEIIVESVAETLPNYSYYMKKNEGLVWGKFYSIFYGVENLVKGESNLDYVFNLKSNESQKIKQEYAVFPRIIYLPVLGILPSNYTQGILKYKLELEKNIYNAKTKIPKVYCSKINENNSVVDKLISLNSDKQNLKIREIAPNMLFRPGPINSNVINVLEKKKYISENYSDSMLLSGGTLGNGLFGVTTLTKKFGDLGVLKKTLPMLEVNKI